MPGYHLACILGMCLSCNVARSRAVSAARKLRRATVLSVGKLRRHCLATRFDVRGAVIQGPEPWHIPLLILCSRFLLPASSGQLAANYLKPMASSWLASLS